MQAAGTVGFVAILSLFYMVAQMTLAADGHPIDWDQMFLAGSFFVGSLLVIFLMITRG